MLDNIIGEILTFILVLVLGILLYSMFMWMWGGMMMANMIGPLFLWWGLPLPDFTVMRSFMLVIPFLPIFFLWLGSKMNLGIDNKPKMFFFSYLLVASLLLNLWPVAAVFGGQYWVRNTVYEKISHENRVEFWHWRASDPWISDIDGSGYYMKYINMRLMEIGEAPLGRNPKWDNIEVYGRILE